MAPLAVPAVPRLERRPDFVASGMRKLRIDVLAADRRKIFAVVGARFVDAAVVASALGTHEKDALICDVVGHFSQIADMEPVRRRSLHDVLTQDVVVRHAEMIGDALHVGVAHERLVAAATLRAARRARDVLGHVLEMLARKLDHLTDRFHELGIVVVFVHPLAMNDLVRVVIPRRLFVVLDRDVLFGNLDLVDVFHWARVEQLGVRLLVRPPREVPQVDEVDGLHSSIFAPPCGCRLWCRER